MAMGVFVVEPVCDAHVVDTIVRPHFSGVLGDGSYRHECLCVVTSAAFDGVAKLPEWRTGFVGVRHVWWVCGCKCGCDSCVWCGVCGELHNTLVRSCGQFLTIELEKSMSKI